MGQFNFRNVGKTQEQAVAAQLTVTPTPVGIITPLQLGVEEIFAVTYTLADQVHDNLRNLILTNYGERLGLYDFGGNLRPLTAEFTSQDDFDSQAVERIKGAVGRWMPYVSLDSFISTVNRNNNKNTGIIDITITYDVPALNVQKKALVVTLYVM